MKPGIPFVPMEPKIRKIPFDSPEFGFQIKWDGTRITAHCIKGRVKLYNRKLRDKTLQYGEIVKALSRRFSDNEVVLDGEIVAIINDKPNFLELMRRDWATSKITINSLAKEIPVTYIVFDLLYFDGECLLNKTFEERDTVLKNIIIPEDPIVVTDTFPKNGRTLYELVKQRALEGIVAKKLSSKYEIGQKSDSWLKIKVKRKILCVIGGFLEGDARDVRSLLLGIYDKQGDLVYIGRAGSGLKASESHVLYDFLKGIQAENSPFRELPGFGRLEPRFVKPELVVRIEFSEWTEKGQLRHPVVIGFSRHAPEDCKGEELV